MKKFKCVLCLMICLAVLMPSLAYARQGDNGYDGGISSGEVPGKTVFEYQEMCFLSGEPIIMKGTLQIKKSAKQGAVASTYTYSLKNTDRAATLTRTLNMNTKITKKDNGQSVEETSLTGRVAELVKIKNTTYTLKAYDFTRTSLVDYKPGINYFSGNVWGKKTYQLSGGTGATASGGTITAEETGNFYGYDQYWGTAELQELNFIINSEQKIGGKMDSWGGTASVSLSSTTSKQLKYMENKPDQISFKGGYIEEQHNESILGYRSRLPEFDSKGTSSDTIIETKNSLKLETFPVQKRLPVPEISHLRGHPAEEDINTLYSLEIFKGNESSFKPEDYMTRAEFAAVLVEAAKAVPQDPALKSKTVGTAAKSTKQQAVQSPYSDVASGSKYFEQIKSAYDRGLMNGGGKTFGPDKTIILAGAVTSIMRGVGLEILAPNPAPVTTFTDNNKIPDYARNAFYVAQRIGLIEGDSQGNANPLKKLTKADVAGLVNKFVKYMRDGIMEDYKERRLNF